MLYAFTIFDINCNMTQCTNPRNDSLVMIYNFKNLLLFQIVNKGLETRLRIAVTLEAKGGRPWRAHRYWNDWTLIFDTIHIKTIQQNTAYISVVPVKMAHLLDLNRREVGVGDFVLLPKVDMDSFLDNLKVRKATMYSESSV